MGCDVHMVLQKKNKKTDQFETVLTDVFPNRDYQLFTFLSGVRGCAGEYDNIAHIGLPSDFLIRSKVMADGSVIDNYHDDYWMGEHSHGWVTLKEFTDAELPDPPSIGDRFETEKCYNGYTVTFLENEEDIDDYARIRGYQMGLKAMFDTYSEGSNYGETYRLVFGYDS